MKVRNLTTIAMLTALTCALSLTFIIPVPQTKGFVTLCEAGIYISALLFGPSAGAFVGGMSGGIIDFLSGYPEWAFFSIVIHGVQGWIVGGMSHRPLAAVIVGSLIMIAGYAAATVLLFGLGAGIASIPSNLIQTVFGSIVALPLTHALRRTKKFSLNER
ncbi:ECF transporter S component [Enterococcus sp. DIV1059_2]|uniref:ECF transporter S component n=1 Tax=Enterococcus sp. DIV1059_2 TaxID=2774664 RepID=UPI003F1F5416